MVVPRTIVFGALKTHWPLKLENFGTVRHSFHDKLTEIVSSIFGICKNYGLPNP